MKSGMYIILVIVAGFVLVGYLFYVTPNTAAAQLPLVLASVGVSVAVLAKLGETDSTLAENTTKTAKIEGKTDRIETMVDGRLTATLDELREVRGIVAELRKDKAVRDVAAAHAETSEARIISAIGAGAAPHTLDVAMPSAADAAALGAAQAVRDIAPGASAGETADAAAVGAAEATKP